MSLPERKYKGDPKSGAADVHPSYRTRKQHLAVIGAMKRVGRHVDAAEYWLTHCPRISKHAFKLA